ncbi:DUF1272 domain-containing protein [Croceitalea sp. MTPC9]|uniref:DUF1272 domain-containing protein n=1 Tax=unclassified Croceitalea TaxID=2632280 RepID=UPI002B3AFA87|nr:DUF1272 domain-containing protein [Croceitalea sp. MTPC6]GMN15360.1 DUF1272 domain-containing protein [Croceitalea sp. MTPC9]
MLELRPTCENCDKPLLPDSQEAMICAYECTFCVDCVDTILENVCPNCGGGFEKRPVRPKKELEKNPPKGNRVYKPVDLDAFQNLKEANKNIPPKDR